MPDTTTSTNTQAAATPAGDANQPVIAPEVRQLMDMSLGINGAQPNQPGGEPGGEPGGTGGAQADPADRFLPISEKFGYKTPEEALAALEELQTFKANPPKPEPIKFENEVSEQIFKAVQAGKVKEVQAILAQQEQLDTLLSGEVNKQTAPEIIKAHFAIKYKDLSPKEIDHKFNKMFGFPKEPVHDENIETEDDFAIRKQEWEAKVAEIEMDRQIEAKTVKNELAAARQNIVLPKIGDDDEDYKQWKESLQSQPTPEQVAESYKDITPKMLELAIDFKDEANKVDFKFTYEPSAEQLSNAVSMVSNFQKFLDHFKKPDGTPDREGFLQAILFAINRKEIMTEGLNQAKNGTIKSKLPDNSQGGLVRDMNIQPGLQQKSEFDKQMDASLKV